LSIHFIAKYFWELGAGSWEPGNANSEDELKNEQKAVSYTHLDVYKRQHFSILPSSEVCRMPTAAWSNDAR